MLAQPVNVRFPYPSLFTVTSPLYDVVEEPAFKWLLGSVPIYQRNAGAVPSPLELFGNDQETELAPLESVVNVNLTTWFLPEFIPTICCAPDVEPPLIVTFEVDSGHLRPELTAKSIHNPVKPVSCLKNQRRAAAPPVMHPITVKKVFILVPPAVITVSLLVFSRFRSWFRLSPLCNIHRRNRQGTADRR